MEDIESPLAEAHLDQVRLCPGCYLVLWHDGSAIQTGQGVPVKPTPKIHIA